MGATIFSCKGNKIEKATNVDVESVPTMEIKDFKVLYTENGIIRHEVTSKIARRYQPDDTTSYIVFPEGLFARSFTLEGLPETQIVADSAVYRQSPDFFEGYRNVVVENLLRNQKLETDTLYWNALTKRIYTTAPSLVIRTPDTIPALQGFESDDKFEDPILRTIKNASIYYRSGNDSTSTDSIPAPIPTDTIR